jgi:dTDP-4-dehydrorhamnose reductase
LDVTDVAAIRDVVADARPEIVFNAAAYTAVDQAESSRDLAFAINATAPRVIAEACAAADVPMVHFSTDYVFAGTGQRPILEDDPTWPLSVYGASKLAGEEAVSTSGARYKTFRLCWVYGPRGENFLLTMLRLASERDELRVVADQFGSPTPASWIADAVVKAVTARPEVTGTFNLAASGSTSWHGFASAIVEEGVRARLLQRAPVVRAIATADYPTPATRPAYSVLHCGRLQRTFGIRLPDWRSGVGQVVGQVAQPH